MSQLRRKPRLVLPGVALLGLAIVGLAWLLFARGGGQVRVPPGVSHLPTAPAVTFTPPGTAKLHRLFSPDSVWNSPVPLRAAVDPSSPQLIRALDAEVSRELGLGIGPWIASAVGSTPLYVVGPHERTVRVELSDPTAWWRQSLQKAFSAVPIPPGARPARGSDAHMTVWQPSTDKLWEFFHTQFQGDRWHAAWGGAIDHVSRNPGYYTQSSWPGALRVWGASATSLPVAAGLITIPELRSGVIDHALSIALPAPRAGVYARPAERSDGTGGPDTIPEGAHLRLDPRLDLDRLHLPPLTRMLAEAAQRYGIIVRDQTHDGISFYAQDPTPYPASNPYWGRHGFFEGKTPQELLASFPWSHLEVLMLHLTREQQPAGA